MSNGSVELLDKRCRKSIAIVMTAIEREAPDAVPGLRKVVMDQFNELNNLANDLLDVRTVVNELWVEKINEIHSVLVGSDG